MRRSILAMALVLSGCGDLAAKVGPGQSGAPALGDGRRVDAATGDDANPGTAALPWRTISQAARAARPGEVVWIGGGTYRERVDVQVSGDASAGVITFQPVPGEQVVLAGDSSFGGTPLLHVRGQHHLRFVGFTVTGYQATGASPIGVWIDSGAHHVEIDGFRVSRIDRSTSAALPIVVSGAVQGTPTHDVVIRGTEVFDSQCAPGQAISIVGNVTGFQILDSHVHDVDCIALDMVGNYGTTIPASPPAGFTYDPAQDRARTGLVRGNVVEDCGGIGIYVDGAQDVVVERNTVRGCRSGVVLAAEIHVGDGIGRIPDRSTVAASGITVRDNVVHDVGDGTGSASAFAIGAWTSGYGPVRNCQVTNNTFASPLGAVQINASTTGLVFANNITTTTGVGAIVSFAPGVQTGNTFLHNGWHSYGTGMFVYDGGSFSTLPFDEDGRTADPLFVDRAAGDLRLQATSPFLGMGTPSVVASGELDRLGAPRTTGGRVDLGAFQR